MEDINDIEEDINDIEELLKENINNIEECLEEDIDEYLKDLTVDRKSFTIKKNNILIKCYFTGNQSNPYHITITLFFNNEEINISSYEGSYEYCIENAMKDISDLQRDFSSKSEVCKEMNDVLSDAFLCGNINQEMVRESNIYYDRKEDEIRDLTEMFKEIWN